MVILIAFAFTKKTTYLSVFAEKSNVITDGVTLKQEGNIGSIGFLKGSIYPYDPQDTSLNPKPSNAGLTNFAFPTQKIKVGALYNIPLTEESKEKAKAYFSDSRGTEEGWQVSLTATSFISEDKKTSFDATFQFADIVTEGKLKRVTGSQGSEVVTPIHKSTREKATVTTSNSKAEKPVINDVIVYFTEVETKDNYTIDLTKTTLDIPAKEMAKIKSGQNYTSTIEWQPAILVNSSELLYGL